MDKVYPIPTVLFYKATRQGVSYFIFKALSLRENGNRESKPTLADWDMKHIESENKTN